MSSKTIRSLVVAGALAALSLLTVQVYARAQTTGASPLPSDRAFQLTATRADDGPVKLEWKIAPGYYLYQERLALKQGQSDIAVPPAAGNAETIDDPTFGVTTIYRARAAITVPVAGLTSAPLEVRYQGCQDKGVCYPPLIRHVDVKTLEISNPDERARIPVADQWTEPTTAPADSPITIANDNGGLVGSLLTEGGVRMVLASFLLFGVLLAFTPCVFPMYPILAGAIARQGEAVTPLRGFSLSVAYVLAMAAAFGLLGFAAAWSGQNLQMALQSPVAIVAVSSLFVAFALSMFGLFELQLPSAWVNAIGGLGQKRRGSLASAGLLGFTSALIVGPCVTAPLAGALIYIAQTGDVLLGAASLFALGLGKGIPLIIFGTIGPQALPKAGAWMTTIRQAFGFIFIATAIWMLSRLVPAEAGLAMWSLFAIGLAVWLGAFDALSADASGGRRTAKAVGFAAVIYGIILAIGAASGAGDPLRPLERLAAKDRSATGRAEIAFHSVSDTRELQSRMAAANGKPSLVYVTADWCVACSIIDRSVLSDPGVRTDLTGLNLIKFDVSDNSPAQRAIMSELQVVGPPTMIFVDGKGRELTGTRLVGDVTRTTLQASAARLGAQQ